jgi:hypothetical protein
MAAQALKRQDGSNGVYAYGSTAAYPTSSYISSNYWVDVVFVPGASQTTQSSSTALAAARVDRHPTDHTDPAPGAMALACSPRSVHPGQSFSCELRLTSTASNLDVQIDGSTTSVTLPALVKCEGGIYSTSWVPPTQRRTGAVTVSITSDHNTRRIFSECLPQLPITAPPRNIAGWSEVNFQIRRTRWSRSPFRH